MDFISLTPEEEPEEEIEEKEIDFIPLTPEEDSELEQLVAHHFRVKGQRKKYYNGDEMLPLPPAAQRIGELTYRKFYRKMFTEAYYRYAGQKTPEAKDMVQDAILLFLKRGSFQGFDPERGVTYITWFSRVYRNAFIDQIREQNRRAQDEVSLDQ